MERNKVHSHQEIGKILMRQRSSHEFEPGRIWVVPPYEPLYLVVLPLRAYTIFTR
jgi:hypothetical protein